ncbi:uncharacterized protein BKCO1_5500066 [Diplodia corticola]|uniref:Uncharacterized protein n=1 Tax=Diplodia corticola TaxID=236234 RepID=A0A1J9RTF3_9PEZI|nr:uncharacterized protein BKCO1_5500066 [Diplodia corticola]OJD30805.1 hypothetical protein BKCO1_5500066 [Diplodia corticola]
MSGFSEREVQLMACAFQAMKTPPEVRHPRVRSSTHEHARAAPHLPFPFVVRFPSLPHALAMAVKHDANVWPMLSQIDYQLMARLAGMSHPGSASNAMRAIRRKLDARVPGTGNAAVNGSPGTPAKKTPRTGGTGKKRSAKTMMSTSTGMGSFSDDDEEAGADAVAESLSKKKIKGKARANSSEDGTATVKVKKETRYEEDEAEDAGEEDIFIEEV